MLKLTLPTEDNAYVDFTTHPSVFKVVALSGGYHRADANKMLARQKGMIASFSRALTEGLTAPAITMRSSTWDSTVPSSPSMRRRRPRRQAPHRRLRSTGSRIRGAAAPELAA